MAELADRARKRLEGLAWGLVDPTETGDFPRWRIPPLGRWRETIVGLVVLWSPFACYQAVLATDQTGLAAWPRGPAAILALVALSWALFLTCHLSANGRWWVWLAVSLFPPLGFAVMPVLLLAVAFAVRGAAGVNASLLAIGALVATGRQAGINVRLPARKTRGAMSESSGISSGDRPIRVMSWNTEYWHQGGDPDEFYAYLRGWDADIYLLQEYLYHVGNWRYRLLDDDERLSAAFSDYQIAVSGQLVTISRLPVVGVPVSLASHVLRVDLLTARDGPVLSTYNVHIPVQFAPVSPLSRTFYRVMRQRAGSRNLHYYRLARDLTANTHPALVAGDFNASPAVGDLRRLADVARDPIRANRGFYPVSWDARRRLPSLWRLDWVFVAGRLTVHRYEFRSPDGRSDHRVQWLLVTVD
jgi:endonuclease/exonuclease/phosphatase (EEP) superfamily protein YafD